MWVSTGHKVGADVSIYKWQWDGCGKDTGDHRDTDSGKDGDKEHSKIIMISHAMITCISLHLGTVLCSFL